MKNTFSYLFIAVLLVGAFSSCKKNNVVIGKEIIPDAYVKFNTAGTSDTVATYYIKSSNAPFKIPVGITNVSNQDRTIQFIYSSSTAVQGVQYNAPTSIIIPAGKALDSLTISGLFSGYASASRVDTLKITITGDVQASPYKSHFILYLRKYCDVIESQITGDYNNTIDYYGGSPSGQGAYTATVTNWVSTGPTTATAYIKNLGATSDNGWGPFYPGDPAYDPGIKVTFDWTNAAKFKVTIAAQNYFNDGSGWSIISSSTGTFSSCDNTITIPAVTKYAGNGSSYTTTTVLSR